MLPGAAATILRRTSSELRRRRLTIPIPHFAHSLSTASSSSNETAAWSGPPPIRVALTETAGRGVFATRGITSGDLIHTAQPVLTHPSPSLYNQVCYYCLKRLGKEEGFFWPVGGDGAAAAMGSSSGSSSWRFCSERCREHSKVFCDVERKVDWLLYNDHCRDRGLKYPLMVKRLACMCISGAASAHILDILQPANLHPNMISEMEEEFELLKSAIMKARFEKCLDFLTKQWYVSVLARVRVNAFRIELIGGSYEDLLESAAAAVAADASVGSAVYMLPSFYNHDCDPNAHIIWIDSANARLKALRDIEEGEELCICYIDVSMDYNARQTLLAQGFGFDCRCLRCLSRD